MSQVVNQLLLKLNAIELSMERLRDENIFLARQLHDIQKLATDESKHSELELLNRRIESLEEERAAHRKVIQSLQAEISDKNTTRTGI